MRNILSKIYSEKLMNALVYTDNYDLIKKIPFIKGYMLTENFINEYLEKINYLYSGDTALTSKERYYSLLSILNDIKNNFNFNVCINPKDLLNKINRCIDIINISNFNRISVIELCKDNKKIMRYMYNVKQKEAYQTFIFFFVHYYLSNNDTFEKEGIPFFCNNMYYYLYCFYSFLNEYHKLTEDKEFIEKTKSIIINCKNALEFNPNLVLKRDYKYCSKQIKRIYKILK